MIRVYFSLIKYKCLRAQTFNIQLNSTDDSSTDKWLNIHTPQVLCLRCANMSTTWLLSLSLYSTWCLLPLLTCCCPFPGCPVFPPISLATALRCVLSLPLVDFWMMRISGACSGLSSVFSTHCVRDFIDSHAFKILSWCQWLSVLYLWSRNFWTSSLRIAMAFEVSWVSEK